MVAVAQSATDCDQTRISWTTARSCSTILDQELQCLGSDRIFTNWQSPLGGSANELVVDASQLQAEPFTLDLGAGIVCRIRSSNENGWGKWSDENDGVSLANCKSTSNGNGSRPQANSPARRPILSIVTSTAMYTLMKRTAKDW